MLQAHEKIRQHPVTALVVILIVQIPVRFGQISHNPCPNPDFLNFRRLFFILRRHVFQALQLKNLLPTFSLLPVRNQSIDIVDC
jgi:hypothetical protein